MTESSKSILLVEDENGIRFAIGTLLKLEGYAVETAENGLVALEFLQKHPMPSLIILDMKMPVMNGWEFAKQLRENFQNSAPIFIMTAAGDAEKRASDIGAVGWIEKPFLLDELLRQIRKYEHQDLKDS